MDAVLLDKITSFNPRCEQEIRDKQLILEFIEKNPDVLDRTNLAAHMTTSAIVLNGDRSKVLFAHHNIYNSWAWVGGHCDGEADLLSVAIREANEETGVKTIRPIIEEIFMLDVILVRNHRKNGKYVPDHLHLNATFLLEADDTEPLTIKFDENSGVRWFESDEVLDHVKEDRMIVVYKKAFSRLKLMKEGTLPHD